MFCTVSTLTNARLVFAKNCLVDDIDKLVMDIAHVANHHDGPNRAKMEVDDILKLLTLMDERLAFDSLLIYVAENVDCLPSMKWADGDFQMIMIKIAKMEKKRDGIRFLISGLAEISHY